MKFDSVFSTVLEVPYPNDRPLMPVEEIERALDAIEAASIEQQTRILIEATDNLLQRSSVFLQARDAAGIESLEWNAAVALQAPIFSVWSMGWQLGSGHMIREMIAAVPERLKRQAEQAFGISRFEIGKLPHTPHPTPHTQAFATAQDKEAIAALLKLQTGTIVNTGAEQAVYQRTLQLAGNFSTDQLKKVKNNLVAAINPDENGKVLSRAELLAKIQTDLKIGKARAETIARTELTNAYNTSRLNTALQSSMVTHMRFLAISDARTTPICRSRNGMLIAVSDLSAIAANKPPLHVRCRSTLSPVMAGINPTHAEWVADPERRIGNRKLEPLSTGWNTGGVPQAPKPPKPEPISHKDLIKAGKADFKATAKQMDAAIAELRTQREITKPLSDKFFAPGSTKEDRNRWLEARQKLQAAKDKAAATMTTYRESLLSRGLTTEQAKALTEEMSIATKITAETAAKLEQYTEEFLRLTGGKAGVSMQHFDQLAPRAYATRDGVINIGDTFDRDILDSDKKGTIWHELGHHVEFENDAIVAASKDWIAARAEGMPKSLNLLTGSTSYGASEIAYPDKFISPYVGKVYANATEAISMGLEHFADEWGMIELYDRDPEHFHLIAGLLRSRNTGIASKAADRAEISILSTPVAADVQKTRRLLSEGNPLVERGRKLGAEIDDIDQRLGRSAKLVNDASTAGERERRLTQGVARAAEIRQALLERSPLSVEAATKLTDQITIPKRGEGSPLTKTEVSNIRASIAEFLRLTGGKGSKSLKKVLASSGEYRAFAEASTGLIDLGPFRYASATDPNARQYVLWHELGHHVEFEDEAIAKQARAWIRSVKTGSPQTLNKITASNAYLPEDKAYPDHFIDPYVGKVYYGKETEVVSMGLEHFVNDRAMFELYRRDPEHFYLILGVIL